MNRSFNAAAILMFVTITWCGCATRPFTQPLTRYQPSEGYYYEGSGRTNETEELLFLVALSGGGTRAASLSYGVLQELHHTLRPGTPARSMLDEIDLISSVSGGSVTAAAYALYGERLFSEYERRFLKRNVQGVLTWRTFNPLNWPWLWSGLAGRSDLAAKYYDEILFGGASFGDLGRTLPYIIINATDVSTGARFEFTQKQFDFICADLSKYPISRAVAASSAVPVALTPITLDNHAGRCGFEAPKWMGFAGAGRNTVPRRAVYRARELRSFSDRVARPYLHLVDGGVSDNLGLRSLIDAFFAFEADEEQTAGNVTRVAILFVNAEHRPNRNWDRKPYPPGILSLGARSSDIPMSHYSYETVELLREKLEHWKDVVASRRGQTNALEFYLMEISFDELQDSQERLYFQNLKTSFHLPADAVDRLRNVGGRLLRECSEYQRLLKDLGPESELRE